MTTVYDIPAKDLIDAVAQKLKKIESIVEPEWSGIVKTGAHKENPPLEKDWWHIRCASILRKIYINGAIGVERLRAEYSGKKDRGSKPYKVRSGSGAIVRKALQQLEKAGFVSKIKGKGRVLTQKGRSFLANTAHEVVKGR
ncbi:MAG: 30S ribosomal protein S19e [Thermoplasmata archaeon]|nr:MAG: 30S ribosomal protein S19e [Thermoplasmata archaeon]